MEAGLYGKLPSHGDFLRRRASDAFVGIWDGWLQDCMATSRSALGDRWLNVYLTSPAWRFVAAAGACGAAPVAGLMVPSVDRVGRYFPLAIVVELPAHINPLLAARLGAPFFNNAERLMIETLAAEHVDFESFDDRVLRLADDLAPFNLPPSVLLDPRAASVLRSETDMPWQVPIGSPEGLAPVLEQLLSHALAATYEPMTMWWTEGSSIVEPSCLFARGLPHPDTFAALLDGSWVEHRWRSVPAQVERPSAFETPLAGEAARLRFRSAGASDVGRVRAINEDSFLEHPESGLWAVADGLGGHSDGETASRMVCDAFADFLQVGTFEDTIEAARDRMDQVNEHLVRAAARSLLGDRSGSTVVALLVRGAQAAVLWAGDSRVYRWRGGRLDQLTRDHSAAGSGGQGGGGDPHAITRAVGAHPRLELDLCRELVQPGDRFLLCSDGLTRCVPEARIGAWLDVPDIHAGVQGLIAATLDAGAPDNVTALIVEAASDGTRLL